MTVEVFAPAKVNLTLHVTGRRADGYHLLDSLVVFAPVGDRILLRRGEGLSLTVDGPEGAGVPATADNLAWKAVHALAHGRGAAMSLTKSLPAASGIGGGSSDAAAAVRGALALWSGEVPAARDAAGPEFAALLPLGADIPMCLAPRPCRARGIGERIEPVDLPPVSAVLVNPRVPVSTPEVFRALAQRENPAMPDPIPRLPDARALIDWLGACRNDLEAPAISVAPVIGEVLKALGDLEGAGLARMSGSGATCFALFADRSDSVSAAARLAVDHPGWWVAEGVLGDQSDRARPQIL